MSADSDKTTVRRLAARTLRLLGWKRRHRGPRDEVMVPMRDGTRLHTVVWRPRGSGPFPTVLTRGYWPGFEHDARRFARHGYAYVGQSTRGHGRSEGAGGIRRRFFHDGRDGHDAISWIVGQPWSDGQVAMYGRSYWASTQWLLALEGHPNLKAIIPQCSTTDGFRWGYWRSGALQLALTACGRAYEKKHWSALDELGWLEFFRHLPLRTLDEVVAADGGENQQLWRDYIEHSTFDDYWREVTIREDGSDGRFARMDVPVFLMAGWYDAYPGAAFAGFAQLISRHPDRDVRLVVNPSDHVNRIVGDRDFGPRAEKDEVALAIRWLDAVVRGRDDGVLGEPPIRLFTMGSNTWQEFRSWPPDGCVPTPYYLGGRGEHGTGTLRQTPPGDEAPSRYRYDPLDPVPTLGGNHSFCETNIADIIRAGTVDQRPVESRPDVLVFTSELLERDTEVTGPIRVRLHVATSAPDTDFVARLIDVHPDGVAYNLTEGILRMRHRDSVWEPPTLVEPGSVHEVEIELLPTSNVFRRGHRIRLHVTSSCFPLWDRNPNTGAPQGMSTELLPADQAVYHDRERPSHVVLPFRPV